MAETNKQTGAYEFNPYAAGARTYGMGQRTNATSGPVSAAAKTGYLDRELRKKARRKAISTAYPTTGYPVPSTTTNPRRA